MSARLKAMFKKQISLSNAGQVDRAGKIRTQELRRSVSENNASVAEEVVTLRRRHGYRRHRPRSSLGILEDIIFCPICKNKLQSPKTLDCQHTFCKNCLEMKLEESSKSEDSRKVVSCSICSSTTTLYSSGPETLPTNPSIERVLRAVDKGTFVARVPDKANSLVVNFAPLIGRRKEDEKPRCLTMAGSEVPADSCPDCDLVFYDDCQSQDVAQLKDQLKTTIDQLQSTISKLEHRVVELKGKTERNKTIVCKEYDARIAALLEEKSLKLARLDDLWTRAEESAAIIKKLMQISQLELAKRRTADFDDVADGDEKVNDFLCLREKATEAMAKALAWSFPDCAEVTRDEGRLRDRENRAFSRPKQLSLRKADLQRPSGLAIDSRRSDVYVACPGSNQVLVLDRLHRIVRRIRNPDMTAPQCVAFVESRQEIYVTDKWKHAIFVYDRRGELVRSIGGEKGSGELQFHSPWGIACQQSRDWLYVADMGNDRVQIIGADGSYKGGIGPSRRSSSSSSSAGADVVAGRIPAVLGVHDFNEPTDVAVNDAAVVVADSGNHKIKVFNHRGQLMFTIGGFGVYKGLLKSPEVVKLDSQSNIYVGDSDNKRVQVFTAQGEFIRAFGSQGSGPGRFGWISGLVCLPDTGDVLVADSISNSLQVF